MAEPASRQQQALHSASWCATPGASSARFAGRKSAVATPFTNCEMHAWPHASTTRRSAHRPPPSTGGALQPYRPGRTRSPL